MSKIPLRPLVWIEHRSPFTDQLCSVATRTMTHEYIICRNPVDLGWCVQITNFAEQRAMTRKKVVDIADGKAWVESDHYPLNMSEWVLTIDEIKRELTQ